jgi:thiamine transport system ATP-binding protein
VAAPGLRIDGVTVRYDRITALDEVSLTVAKGETVAVVGPSGSGKSTLLRAVAGLEPLAGGRIEADGADLRPVPVHRRDLGLMFQDHALFPHLDVAGNVGFGLRRRGWSRRRRDERAGELLELVGLAGYERRAVHQLSGGEAQRVALARALAPEPGLLMLDEPFGSLDRVLREELTDELRVLLERLGQTALHVTHDQAEAFALADRVAVMRAGRVVQFDRPARLWSRPDSVFVATFVGQPNVWEVDVTAGGVVSLAGKGRELGRNPDLASGRSWLMVPAAAVAADPGGAVEAVVRSSQFREGAYRITADLGTPADSGPANGPVVTFAGPDRLISGRTVRLEVGLDRAVQLDGDGTRRDEIIGSSGS